MVLHTLPQRRLSLEPTKTGTNTSLKSHLRHQDEAAMYPILHGTKKSAKTLPNLSGRVKLNSAQRRAPYHGALIGSHIEVNSLDQAQVLKLVRCRQSCKLFHSGGPMHSDATLHTCTTARRGCECSRFLLSAVSPGSIYFLCSSGKTLRDHSKATKCLPFICKH